MSCVCRITAANFVFSCRHSCLPQEGILQWLEVVCHHLHCCLCPCHWQSSSNWGWENPRHCYGGLLGFWVGKTELAKHSWICELQTRNHHSIAVLLAALMHEYGMKAWQTVFACRIFRIGSDYWNQFSDGVCDLLQAILYWKCSN